MQRFLSLGLGLALVAGCRGASPGALNAGVESLDGAAPLIGTDAGTFIGPDAGTFIGPDAGTFIGPDGDTLIGPDGGTLQTSTATRSVNCLARSVFVPTPEASVAAEPLSVSFDSSVVGLRATWQATAGALSTTTGREVSWTPPAAAGTYSLEATLTAPNGEQLRLVWTATVEGAVVKVAPPAPRNCP
jgi:hypothetical protein